MKCSDLRVMTQRQLLLPTSSAARLLLCLAVWASTMGSAAEEAWPACMVVGKSPQNAQKLRADVRAFIKHPDTVRHKVITFSTNTDIGMILREKPHANGELVDGVKAGSQAESSGVRKGWIITSINGQKFSPTERLKDLAQDFTKAKQAGSTLVVKYDVRTAIDCTDSDCHFSDRFPADSPERCSLGCSRTPGCEWWSWGSHQVDKMCFLYERASGFETSLGVTSGSRACSHAPVKSEVTSFPGCTTPEADLHNGRALYFDARPFINRPDHVRHKEVIFTSSGNIGMGLREQPHDLGEVVSDVLDGSQAMQAGVQIGWIIKEVNGKPFQKKETVVDVGTDFNVAKTQGPTLTVKFDVKESSDCANGNCKSTDKFPVETMESCASTCSQVLQCQSWSFATEEEDAMCWLREDFPSLRPEIGSTVGGRDCTASGSGRWFFALCGALLVAFAVARHLQWTWVARVPTMAEVHQLVANPAALKEKVKAGGIGKGLSSMLELGPVRDSGRDDELDSLMGGKTNGKHSGSNDTNGNGSWNAGGSWKSAVGMFKNNDDYDYDL
eukprot:TRINITY_DN123148_c0_g1_i1.p1 TRINITY_DN123148_c0_g1~~TRINITY_DN123148_c0_g1_i1.p1  ORF type:complete len:556 (-),score=124.58 TRINITY_DN123148_c0_g1_i1:133-1800(-)